MGCGLDGGEQGLAGILPGHAQELAQGQRRLQLAAALEAVEVGLDLGQQAEQILLLGERFALPPALAAGRPMLGPEHVAVAGSTSRACEVISRGPSEMTTRSCVSRTSRRRPMNAVGTE